MNDHCFGDIAHIPLYVAYHDKEWGVPVYDDHLLFEMLILEAMQAGLSWITVLKKRAFYNKAFFDFDIDKVAALTDEDLEERCKNQDLIRNRAKIYAIAHNARIFKKIQKEYGSFSKYLWRFIADKPRVNRWRMRQDIPSQTEESNALSKDLKSRGMKFVGPVTMYAYMQAVGLINDHLEHCPSK